MIKLIATDLDGTLLNEKGELSKKTCQALKAATASGIKTVIATGRPYCALPRQLICFPGIDYAITSNGSSIFRLKDGERIFARDLKGNTVRNIIDVIDSLELTLELETVSEGICHCGRKYYADPVGYNNMGRSEEYVQSTRLPVDDMTEHLLENISSFEEIAILLPELSIRDKLIKRLFEIPDLYITGFSPWFIELAEGSVSKASALKELALRLGISREEIIAFGDAINDKELLEYAGLGVAMANADDELKAIADDVAAANYEDGVARYLERILLGPGGTLRSLTWG